MLALPEDGRLLTGLGVVLHLVRLHGLIATDLLGRDRRRLGDKIALLRSPSLATEQAGKVRDADQEHDGDEDQDKGKALPERRSGDGLRGRGTGSGVDLSHD